MTPLHPSLQSLDSSRPGSSAGQGSPFLPESLTIDRLVEAGVHFGSRAAAWNPKMKPYILGKHASIHLIDLRHTVRGLVRAEHFLEKIASTGARVLFVGTKRSIRGVVEECAKRCGMPYVVERWIGGTLTNFQVVRSRFARLEELEALGVDGGPEGYSKKVLSRLRREKRKIVRNLDGIRTMTDLPGAVLVVDPRREDIAIRECRRAGTPSVCVLDTDCDPDDADIPIPANDDAMKSVGFLLDRLAEAIRLGRARHEAGEGEPAPRQPATSEGAGDFPTPRPRAGSRRPVLETRTGAPGRTAPTRVVPVSTSGSEVAEEPTPPSGGASE